MLPHIGPAEMLLVVLVVFLLFGASKLPEIARSLGRSARILKSEARAMRSDAPDVPDVPDDPVRPPGQSALPSARAEPSGKPTEQPNGTRSADGGHSQDDLVA
ncbi:twin-arginine translocase TatA/TatE family subunit [Streptomyces tirandamycinicus]|uniref:twin-arginine translocase TatA/TatE family subunit n=1 Tax=Streptomyces tirandamycinicus TaxID=2174846 RepID=UPI00226E1378|nr:twin-arginine translocase TatA/TatE family subunit [Streptomyces tirandamycinicus]MCY0984495.1 twin-arginine translocase TatA/TatE family subunit [Streptomyces tirandamycinicus]